MKIPPQNSKGTPGLDLEPRKQIFLPKGETILSVFQQEHRMNIQCGATTCTLVH